MSKRYLLLGLWVIGMLVFNPGRMAGAVFLNDPPPTAIQGLIVDGTSLFLQSNASAFLLLNEIELSEKRDFNFDYTLVLTDSALNKLQAARGKYQEAVSVGRANPSANAIIQKYKNFDYRFFARERKLNQEIMGRLSGFLKNGDFVGVVEKSVEDIDEIILLLEEIRNDLTSGLKPDVQLFRTLLQKYNTLGLFGNYAAVLFNSI